jgi:hypothetical protein
MQRAVTRRSKSLAARAAASRSSTADRRQRLREDVDSVGSGLEGVRVVLHQVRQLGLVLSPDLVVEAALRVGILVEVAAVDIQKLAGHQSIAVTNKYMHTTETSARAAIKLLERAG